MTDVVVVGGGSAGCVVASRLAEDPSRSVMLLEAGPDVRADIPVALRDGWTLAQGADWRFDWGFVAEDGHGEAETVRRGKLLGGTSWLTRFALRGSPADYDEWAALGNTGWAFDDVLPSFRRLETDAEFGAEPWHGDAGPIPVTRYPGVDPSEIAAAIEDACGATGFPMVEDHHRPGAVGVGRMPMSSRDGRRVTTADAYLPTGATPSNLTIRAGAHVAEVVFDGTRATGVRLLDGTVIEAEQIVLSAGTYASPTILLRSGIGPADDLRALDIAVKTDLRGVGTGLGDHPAIDIDPGYRGPSRDAPPLLHAVATFHSSTAPVDGAPDLMFWIADPWGEPPAITIDIVLLKPRSRGSVRLRSADPTQPPRIELPRLSDPTDVDRLAEGYRRAWDVANRPGLRRLCDSAPAPEIRDQDELRAWVRDTAYSIPHVVGTCAMGTDPGAGAVVDPSGSVHGTERLSVVDASIMPTVPSGFPHLITIMLAEHLSERIAALS